MALTKIGKEGITGISNSADATFLTATSSEGVTLAGTLAVTGVHTVGTNAVATSDGGAATTSIVQGLAKAWFDITGVSTAAINDSLNISSMSDNGTGDYSIFYNNDMASVNHSTIADVNFTTSGDAQNTRITAIAAASVRTVTTTTGNADVGDARKLLQTSHGDLA